MESIGEIKQINNRPSIAFEHVISSTSSRIRNLTLNNQVGIWMRLNMLNLMTNIINKSVSVWHFRICFRILNWQLSIVTKRSSVVIGSVYNLHLSKVSWNSRNNIKEQQTSKFWIILDRSRSCVWEHRDCCFRRKTSCWRRSILRISLGLTSLW